jgi:hypothetical protein
MVNSIVLVRIAGLMVNFGGWIEVMTLTMTVSTPSETRFSSIVAIFLGHKSVERWVNALIFGTRKL